jgi:hypothetical protein
MSTSRDKRLEKAQMRVLFQVPFFAPGVAKLPVRWDDTIDTACTDGGEIRFSGKFFDTLKDQEVVTVLAHEVAHCLLGHIWRAPGGREVADWDIWNQATDHAVNNMLREFAEQVTSKNFADPFPLPGEPGEYCCDPAFKDLSEEVIYERLRSQKPRGGKSGSKGSGSGSGKPGAGNGAQARPSMGQIQAGKTDPAVQKRDKADWEATLQQCIISAKGRGELPGSIARYAGELLNPTVPWPELLRNLLREFASDDYDWMRPNQYFDGADFILPSLHSEKIGAVVFAVDTSGSIDLDLLTKFKSEMQSCLDDLRPSKLVEICADSVSIAWVKTSSWMRLAAVAPRLLRFLLAAKRWSRLLRLLCTSRTAMGIFQRLRPATMLSGFFMVGLRRCRSVNAS